MSAPTCCTSSALQGPVGRSGAGYTRASLEPDFGLVAFNHNGVEFQFRNQSASDLGAHAVAVQRAVHGLPKKYEPADFGMASRAP